MTLIARFCFIVVAGTILLSSRPANGDDISLVRFDFAKFVEGKWEPAGELQDLLGTKDATRFYEFRSDQEAKKRFEFAESLLSKLGLHPGGSGFVKQTVITFVAGQETNRSEREFPFVACGSAEGLPLILYDRGSAMRPNPETWFMQTVRGSSRERDVLLLSEGRGAPVAFRRLTVRPPSVISKSN